MDDVNTESATEAAAKPSTFLPISHLSEASIDARVEKALNLFSTPSRELLENLGELATSLHRVKEQRIAFRNVMLSFWAMERLQPEKLIYTRMCRAASR